MFYDTWAYLALSNAADADHLLAVEADRHLESIGAVSVTSDWIVDETLTGLHARAGARVALAFLGELESLLEAGELTLLHVSVARRDRALASFKRLARDTPRLSLTDCTSFVLMQELSIGHAFTADVHFAKAGRGARPLFARRKDGLVFRAP